MPATTASASTPGPGSTVLIALSGPTCSGKTTISRLLRDTLAPRALILHQDDFYKPDAQIPLATTSAGDRVQDWDCAASLDLPALDAALRHVRTHGSVPAGFESSQDRNPAGDADVDGAVVARWSELFAQRVPRMAGLRIVVVDGFLLFSEAVAGLRPFFDAKLLLRTPYADVRTRREARQGYVTQEGFWRDPPGYVDEVVWPNYVRDHAFLFRDGDVEGDVAEDICEELGVKVLEREMAGKGNITAIFEWVAGVVLRLLQERTGNDGI